MPFYKKEKKRFFLHIFQKISKKKIHIIKKKQKSIFLFQLRTVALRCSYDECKSKETENFNISKIK
jgi:hypothetical protein